MKLNLTFVGIIATIGTAIMIAPFSFFITLLLLLERFSVLTLPDFPYSKIIKATLLIIFGLNWGHNYLRMKRLI